MFEAMRRRLKERDALPRVRAFRYIKGHGVQVTIYRRWPDGRPANSWDRLFCKQGPGGLDAGHDYEWRYEHHYSHNPGRW